jgi:hypothetical protein
MVMRKKACFAYYADADFEVTNYWMYSLARLQWLINDNRAHVNRYQIKKL